MGRTNKSDTRERAAELFLRGLSYAAIGREIGVSRQRAQQLVRPPVGVYSLVKSRANGACEKCAVRIDAGHVHHVKGGDGFAENFNDIDNLKYLCAICHGREHFPGPKGKRKAFSVSAAERRILNRLQRKMKVSVTEIVRISLHRLAEAEGLRVA